jgi:MFS family permease
VVGSPPVDTEPEPDPGPRVAPAVAPPALIAAPTGGWVTATFSSLSVPTYRTLWLATLASIIATFIMFTAQSLVAYDLTGNNRAVGWVALGQGLAMLFLSPFGGAVADRVSKRFLLVVTNLIMAFSVAATAALTFTDNLNVFWLALGSFLMGSMFSFIGPARTAYIGELVGPARRGNAIALTQVGMNGARIVGPFIAAAILSVRALGYGGVFVLVSVLFVLIIAMLMRLPPTTGRVGAGRSSMVADVRLGFNHVVANPRLLPLVIGFITITSLSQPYMVVLPGFTKDVLDTGNEGFGIVIGVAAVGGLILSLLVASMADSPRARLLLHLSAIGLGGGLILTGLAPTFPAVLAAITVVGGCSSAFQTLNSAIALRESSAEYFGRVMSLMMMAWSVNGVVSLPAGWLADLFGERTMLVAMGVAVWIASAALYLWSLRVRRAAPTQEEPVQVPAQTSA